MKKYVRDMNLMEIYIQTPFLEEIIFSNILNLIFVI